MSEFRNKNCSFDNSFLDKLPDDFPRYTVKGKSVSKEDIIIVPNMNAYFGYILILDYKGNLKYYKKTPLPSINFKKVVNSKGLTRYTYFEVVSLQFPEFPVNGGYLNTELVVLDECLREIDRVKLIKCGSIIEDTYPCENHDFIFIDDGHYIVPAYYPSIVNNIPGITGNYKVCNNIIQEIKNGHVISHFETINFPELYDASCFSNNFSDFPVSQPIYNDYAHFNSIVIDEKDKNLLISFRKIGLVKIERYTGNILWVMGRKRNDIEGATNTQIPFKQHDAKYYNNSSITVFDNEGASSNNTRVCRYEIDETEKKLIYFEEYVTKYPKNRAMGGSILISKKDKILDITYGVFLNPALSPAFEEYDFKNDIQLMMLTFENNYSVYRIFRGIEDNTIYSEYDWHCET